MFRAATEHLLARQCAFRRGDPRLGQCVCRYLSHTSTRLFPSSAVARENGQSSSESDRNDGNDAFSEVFNARRQDKPAEEFSSPILPLTPRKPQAAYFETTATEALDSSTTASASTDSPDRLHLQQLSNDRASAKNQQFWTRLRNATSDLLRWLSRRYPDLAPPMPQEVQALRNGDRIARDAAKYLEYKALWDGWAKNFAAQEAKGGCSLSTVVFQMLLSLHGSHWTRNEMSNAFGDAKRWKRKYETLNERGHSLEALQRYVYILRGPSDEERCRRFLEERSYKPLFLLRYLVNSKSNIRRVGTLHGLIDHLPHQFDRSQWEEGNMSKLNGNPKLKAEALRQMGPELFSDIVESLAAHAFRLDPRSLPKIADAIAHYVESLGGSGLHPRWVHLKRSQIINAGLALFQPRRIASLTFGSFPNAAPWEAQQKLLALSSSFAKPLLIDASGFRAVREVLAGQEKNPHERHNASRQAPTWPPYLLPTDGLDEASSVEDNWGRAVQAGVMMQEAGFPKTAADEALDILEGMAPDGTPTIQQRVVLRNASTTIWAASIRATRNAHEAWQQFKHPPEPEMIPGQQEYGAMFAKVVAPSIEAGTSVQPGDKSGNFPVHVDRNLVAIDRAKDQPPTLTALYDRMLDDGHKPSSTILHIVVSHAQSLEEADRFLLDADMPEIFNALTNPQATKSQIMVVPATLYMAYIDMLCGLRGSVSAWALRQAMSLISKRASATEMELRAHATLKVMRSLRRHAGELHLSIPEQLDLIQQACEAMNYANPLALETFLLLVKCVRKIVGRELPEILDRLESQRECALFALYDHEEPEAPEESPLPGAGILEALRKTVKRQKDFFRGLVEREKKRSALRRGGETQPSLEDMSSRRDPARAEHVHQYMLSLAYTGEFEEMANVLVWAANQWRQSASAVELQDAGQLPRFADITETLCLFRLVAEPMLDSQRVKAAREAVSIPELLWVWPEDEDVKAFSEAADQDLELLDRVGKWIRYRRHMAQKEAQDQEDLL